MTTYCKIPESDWLFRDQVGQRRTEDAKWTPAEEPVRQWCLHELVRTYGVGLVALRKVYACVYYLFSKYYQSVIKEVS